MQSAVVFNANGAIKSEIDTLAERIVRAKKAIERKPIQLDRVTLIDSLGRTALARHLVQIIQAIDVADGAVIGLEGEWGSGKSWILNAVERANEEEEEDRKKLILVRFSPWMLNGATSIVEALLVQIAAEVNNSGRVSLERAAEIANSVLDYAQLLSLVKHLAWTADLVFPGASTSIQAVGAATQEAVHATRQAFNGVLKRADKKDGSLSLQRIREKTRGLLAAENRRLVVVVDDLDRLDPASLGTMMHAVKAVADFPNVVYLLAYDPRAAANCLETALQLEQNGGGLRYLEKIVQVQIRVPEIPAAKIQSFAKQTICQSFDLGELEKADREDFEEALPLAAALLETPRDVARFKTRLEILPSYVKGEVSPADLVLIEALTLKAPQLVQFIDTNRWDFLQARLEQYRTERTERSEINFLDWYDFSLNKEQVRRRREEQAKRWENHLLGTPRLVAAQRRAMEFLFDVVIQRNSSSVKHARRLRLQQWRSWCAWRSVFRYDDELSVSDFLARLKQPRFFDWSDVLSSKENFWDFCARLQDAAEDASKVDAIGVAHIFLSASRQLGEEILLNGNVLVSPRAAFLSALAKDENENRDQAIRKLFTQETVWFSGLIVLRIHNQIFGGDLNPPASPEEHLIPEIEDVRNLIAAWRTLALNKLEAIQEPVKSRPAYWLALWCCARSRGSLDEFEGSDTVDMKKEVKKKLTRLVNLKDGLEIVFGSTEYDDSHLQGGLPDDDALPDREHLLAAAQKASSKFKERHKRLIATWQEQKN